jgi:hypothetical protein
MKNTDLKPGDVIGFAGSSAVSDLINIVTFGVPRYGLSHVGIMGEAADGRLLLFESTTLNPLPCEIKGKVFNGSQAHSLDAVLKGYRGKVWRYPLYRELYDAERERLSDYLMKTIGIPYDKMGAMRSAGVGLSYIESLLPEHALMNVYCSEWVSEALEQIGICPAAHFNRYNPNRLLRRFRKANLVCKPMRLK